MASAFDSASKVSSGPKADAGADVIRKTAVQYKTKIWLDDSSQTFIP